MLSLCIWRKKLMFTGSIMNFFLPSNLQSSIAANFFELPIMLEIRNSETETEQRR